MGLETAHPEALEKLNKRMTLDGFDRAARWLARHGIAVRAFVLVHPPFIPGAERETWLARSVDHAFAAGATAVSLIPLRGGNGTVEAAPNHAPDPAVRVVARGVGERHLVVADDRVVEIRNP